MDLMKATVDLNSKAELLSIDHGTHPHEILIRLPNAAGLFELLPRLGCRYGSAIVTLAVYSALFIFIPAIYAAFVQKFSPYGQAWVFLGFMAALVAGLIVFRFSGHRHEKIVYAGISVFLTISVVLVAYAATTRLGHPLSDPEKLETDRVYWSSVVQNGVVVLGGGFAGNLFLEAMRNSRES